MQHNSGGFVALSHEARRCGLVKGDAVGEHGRRQIHGLRGRKSLQACYHVCPELKVLEMDTPYYRDVSSKLQACIQECLGPHAVVAKASIDDFYVDLTAIVATLVESNSPITSQNFRCVHAKDSSKLGVLRWESKRARQVTARWQQAYTLAGQLRQHVAARFGPHFTLSLGMGTSKLVARLVSSLNKPDGQTCCLPQDNSIVAQCTPLKLVPSLRHAQGDKLLDLITSAAELKASSVRTSTRHAGRPKPKPKAVEPVMLAALLTVPMVSAWNSVQTVVYNLDCCMNVCTRLT
jgi:nucleotidyltransferase/DNA polymerase involved in DNA repair